MCIWAYQVTAEHKMDLGLRLSFQYRCVFFRSSNIYEGLGTGYEENKQYQSYNRC